MKDATARSYTIWIFLTLIVAGAITIIVMLTSNNAPPANAVLIESAGAGTLGKSQPILPKGSINTLPTPTAHIIKLEGGTSPDKGTSEEPIAEETPQAILGAPSPTPAMIAVYISGAVAQPGVVFLAEGARVQDAIAAAGGALIQADLDSINLAQKLVDEAHVIIGRRDEGTTSSVVQPTTSIRPLDSGGTSGQSVSQAAGPKPTPSGLIDINTATQAQFESLPGVGPSLAARIITDRENNGPFASIEDLMRVSGIKEGILSKIREFITVGH
jgi:competence protein ComEA